MSTTSAAGVPPAPAAARSPWLFMGMAAAILMITMGVRQSLGLFVSPLNTHPLYEDALSREESGKNQPVLRMPGAPSAASMRDISRALASPPIHLL